MATFICDNKDLILRGSKDSKMKDGFLRTSPLPLFSQIQYISFNEGPLLLFATTKRKD